MQKQLQEALADAFPFMRRGLSMAQQEKQLGSICDLYGAFGLEIGDGWYQLIQDMCREIAAAYEAEGAAADLVVDQVKEKYGTLRFYYHHKAPGTEAQALGCLPVSSELRQTVERIVDDYEEKSAHVCELCGKPGSLREDLEWMLTLCDEHYRLRKRP